ncbi:MAG: ROK family protein [Actinomycetota bacterium]|nr:ROK family protein [Actinomycetota bacterium]
MMLEIKGDNNFVIGIDMGKEELIIVLANFNGKIIKKYQGFKMIKNIKNLDIKIANEIKKFLKEDDSKKPVRLNDIKGICIGFSASIDIRSGKIINSVLSRNWEGLAFETVLGREFKVPIYLENDVNLSAIAEKRFGKGKNSKNIIFMEISNGIGVGIIIDDFIYRGSRGTAGEIAYKIIGIENLSFNIEDKGFFESYASMEGFKKRFVDEVRNGMESIVKSRVRGKLEKIEPYMIVEAAKKGDKLSKNFLKKEVDLLSISLIDLILNFDPEIIVLGGDILKLPMKEDYILKPIIENVKNIIPFEIPAIDFSSLDEDACIIGAADFAINSQVVRRFPYKI